MPRFVILEHDHPGLHWDFMLEEGATLSTWRLAAPPGAAPSVVAAERIGDHRLLYLDYEGPVSRGRGSVKRWDGGTFEEEPAVASGQRSVRLAGGRWRGRVMLPLADGYGECTFQPESGGQALPAPS